MSRYFGRESNGMVWVSAFGWQLDYRPDGWLPLSIHTGKRRWHIIPLGRFGCVTLAPITPLSRGPR